MKLKKVLLTIVIALVTVMLLQLNVNAEEIDYSEYDYLLTETGVVAKDNLKGTEIVIAGIKGTSGNGISVDTVNKKININNFTGDTLKIFNYEFDLWVEGENSIKNISGSDYASGNGKIVTDSYIYSNFVGYSYNEAGTILHFGNSIDNSVSQIYMSLGEESIDTSGKILDSVAEKICKYLELEGNIYFELAVPNDTIIPESIFAKLKTCNNRYLCMYDDSAQFTFNSSNIENTNVDFKIGVEFSENPIGNMTVLFDDIPVEYIKFKNNGTAPGKVEIHMNMGGEEENEPDPLCEIVIKSFNEDTKSYEHFGSVADPYRTLSLLGKGAILYPQGGYAIYHAGYGYVDITYQEIEVKSLEWTKEDINNVLAVIEELKGDSESELILYVQSGSKVPSKIFEAAEGVNIYIKSDDGICAHFSGENYKAIDYVAGGNISKKPFKGMINVGEDSLVYISLKHEGQLPSTCEIVYLNEENTDDMEEILENSVKSKLYYFNEKLQKYELCGYGYMNIEADYYAFELEHCSSYVMSEKSLDDKFVVDSKVEDDDEKSKNEGKDETKAPGKIPHAGGTIAIIIAVLGVTVIGTVAYIKNKDLKGI